MIARSFTMELITIIKSQKDRRNTWVREQSFGGRDLRVRVGILRVESYPVA